MTTQSLSPLDRLRTCEAVIERTKGSAWDFVRALKEIKEDGLWHEATAPKGEADYANFDDYAQRRFGFGRNYANRLLKGLEVRDSVPIGTDLNEAQARELGKVPPENRERILDAAKKIGGGTVTAETIRKARESDDELSEVICGDHGQPADPQDTMDGGEWNDGSFDESPEPAKPDHAGDPVVDRIREICRSIQCWTGRKTQTVELLELIGKLFTDKDVAVARSILENIATELKQ